MNINVENTGPCKKLLKVEVPYSEMKDDVNRIRSTVQQKAAIPGFRAGKAPWNLIEQYYGGTVDTEIKNQVVHSVFPKVLEEKKIHPVRSPVVSKVEYKKDEGLSFQMEVEIAPLFELPQYIGIEIEKKGMEVTEEHIEEELKHIQQQNARFDPVTDRPATMGDFIIIDYEIMASGKKEVLDQAKQVWIEMKEDFFIPKFCAQLAGMEKGQEKNIKLTLPKKYPKPDLSGKKIIMHVKLNEIKKKIVPAIDDEFAKVAVNTNSLDELKTKIRKQLEDYTERLIEKDMIGQIESYLLDNTQLDVPQSVVDSFDDVIYKDKVSWLKNSGKASDELIKEKDAEIRTDTRKEAVGQVKLLYILEEIANKEKIETTDSEINNRIEEICRTSGKNEKEIRDYLDKNEGLWNFKYKLRNEKLINFLLDKAKIKEVPSLKPQVPST